MCTLRFLTFEIWHVIPSLYWEKEHYLSTCFYFILLQAYYYKQEWKKVASTNKIKKAQPVYDEDVGGRVGQSSWFASLCFILQCCVSYIDISLWMLYKRYERNDFYINAFEKRFCITEELGFYVVFLNDCRNYFEQRRYWV